MTRTIQINIDVRGEDGELCGDACQFLGFWDRRNEMGWECDAFPTREKASLELRIENGRPLRCEACLDAERKAKNAQ